jgi:nucleotide-binding universal stress UspA family protein
MKHLLVATDFSETANAALGQAVDLAQACGARITLLNVIFAEKLTETLLGLDAMEYLTHAVGGFEDGPQSAVEQLRRAAEDKLRAAIASIPSPHPEITPIVLLGRPSVEIAHYADAHDVDLIVLGTHGRGPIGKAFLGSVADHVLRQADVPVMVVPK